MAETSFPTWIIVQRHGMVPDKKGPFYLREFNAGKEPLSMPPIERAATE